MPRKNSRSREPKERTSLNEISAPERERFLEFVEQGKEASRKSERKYESVRHVSKEDMNLLL